MNFCDAQSTKSARDVLFINLFLCVRVCFITTLEGSQLAQARHLSVSTTYSPNNNADIGRSQITLSDDIQCQPFLMAGEQKQLIKDTPVEFGNF